MAREGLFFRFAEASCKIVAKIPVLQSLSLDDVGTHAYVATSSLFCFSMEKRISAGFPMASRKVQPKSGTGYAVRIVAICPFDWMLPEHLPASAAYEPRRARVK